MNCPTCHTTENSVLRTDSDRPNEIRRIRRCDLCGHRWATVELVEASIAADRQKLARARELAAALVEG